MTQAEAAYKTSAEEAEDRNDLVMQELSQVYYIASRIRERLPQHVELEDLVNAGVIGLLEASRTFDSSKMRSSRRLRSFASGVRFWIVCVTPTGDRAICASVGARLLR